MKRKQKKIESSVSDLIKDTILKEAGNNGFISIDFLNDIIPEETSSEYIDKVFHFLDEKKIDVASQKLYQAEINKLFKSSKIWLPDVDKEMLAYYQKNPLQLFNITSRKFEELIASIFRNQGFYVELTPPVKDGGFDFVAVQHDVFTGKNIYLVECKKYAPSNPVGVGIVRSLYGVINDQKATKGIIATTSFFTKGAVELYQRHKSQLSINDYDKVAAWLDNLNFNI